MLKISEVNMGSQPINESMINDCSPKENINESMKKLPSVARADRIAHELERRFSKQGIDAEPWHLAILKVAWRLSEARIWEVYEASFKPKVKKPLAYFLGACRREWS